MLNQMRGIQRRLRALEGNIGGELMYLRITRYFGSYDGGEKQKYVTVTAMPPGKPWAGVLVSKEGTHPSECED